MATIQDLRNKYVAKQPEQENNREGEDPSRGDIPQGVWIQHRIPQDDSQSRFSQQNAQSSGQSRQEAWQREPQAQHMTQQWEEQVQREARQREQRTQREARQREQQPREARQKEQQAKREARQREQQAKREVRIREPEEQVSRFQTQSNNMPAESVRNSPVSQGSGNFGASPGYMYPSIPDHRDQTDAGHRRRTPFHGLRNWLSGMNAHLPEYWGVDLFLILLGVIILVETLLNLEEILSVIAYIIYSILDFSIGILAFLLIASILLFMIRPRRW